MERESQPAHSGLTERLRDDIWRVNFYRYCQLLEQENPDTPPLGSTDKLSNDPVRFRPWPGMGFPVSELKAVEIDEDHPDLVPSSARKRDEGVATCSAVPGIPSPTRPSRHCEISSAPPASNVTG